MIRQRFSDAQFRTGRDTDDSSVVQLIVTVDVEDTEVVLDVVIDRMMEMQIEEGLPIFVVPLRPVERSWEIYRAERAESDRRAAKAEAL